MTRAGGWQTLPNQTSTPTFNVQCISASRSLTSFFNITTQPLAHVALILDPLSNSPTLPQCRHEQSQDTHLFFRFLFSPARASSVISFYSQIVTAIPPDFKSSLLPDRRLIWTSTAGRFRCIYRRLYVNAFLCQVIACLF
jgi:hypothetical protein